MYYEAQGKVLVMVETAGVCFDLALLMNLAIHCMPSLSILATSTT